MGVVYEALQQNENNRRVALKMLLQSFGADLEGRLRFEREIQILNELSHPNIIGIYDSGIIGDQPFYVMPFMEGGSLARWTNRPWGPAKAADLIRAIARAMHTVHEKGVVHRDLKPGNILCATEFSADVSAANPDELPTGRWDDWLRDLKIADFGVAKRLDGQTIKTSPGEIRGTLAYCAPEQIDPDRWGEVKAWTDVYALGVILYELLKGERPFNSIIPPQLIAFICDKEPPPLPPTVPEKLADVCVRCLRKQPDERPTIAELARDLEQWQRPPQDEPRTSDAAWLTHTTDEAIRRMEEIRALLHNPAGAAAEAETRREPIRLDFSPLCLEAYLEALSKVQTRFWTTTFIESPFWTNTDVEHAVLAANSRLLNRFKENKGEARRLFLLSQDPNQAAEAYKQKLIHLMREGKNDELLAEKAKLVRLKVNIGRLIKSGFEVRIVYDEQRRYVDLAKGMGFNPNDGELAIYDDQCVDIFGGGRAGKITDVTIFSGLTAAFKTYLGMAENCFKELWPKGESVEAYFERLEHAERAASKRIQYVSNWLARYEYDLAQSDQEMKESELSAVLAFLTKTRRAAKVKRYLDVGTCTARYPRALRDVLNPRADLIVGIDDDPDCVEFARRLIQDEEKRRKKQSGLRRRSATPSRTAIRVEQANFCSESYSPGIKFDLITCMLGTLSHFGWDRDRTDQPSEELGRAIRRFARLLAPGGLLVLGSWSEQARQKKEMLSIYERHDCERLARWTPTLQELLQLLNGAGLGLFEPPSRPHPKIDLLFGTHKTPDVNLWVPPTSPERAHT
jgi:serine/threonine protein kinase/SAM-dependent methyltransferase